MSNEEKSKKWSLPWWPLVFAGPSAIIGLSEGFVQAIINLVAAYLLFYLFGSAVIWVYHYVKREGWSSFPLLLAIASTISGLNQGIVQSIANFLVAYVIFYLIWMLITWPFRYIKRKLSGEEQDSE